MKPMTAAERDAMIKKYPHITEAELYEWDELLVKSFAAAGILNDKDLARYLELADRMRIKYA